jgi:glutamine amidotransferase
MICVIDYGIGNLGSVKKALDYLGVKSIVCKDGKELSSIAPDSIILPGVGAFGATMQALNLRGFDVVIKEAINGGVNFLGICVGLQILFETSEESPLDKGLAIFKGTIKKLDVSLRVPQMQWNLVNFTDSAYLDSTSNWYYFVHSYYLPAEPLKTSDFKLTGVTNYEVLVGAMIERDNILAVQFHPEKSGKAGLALLESFVKKTKRL